MKKKIIYLGIALVMLFSLAGLSACGDIELTQYKTTAKTAIQSHADSKIESNGYSAEGLAEIAVIVSNGIAAVTAAEDKPAVDVAKLDAIQAIDDVPQEEDGMWYEKEKLFETFWDGKVEVSIVFLKEIQQGESFEITVTTTNISDDILSYDSCYCCSDMGILIAAITLKTDNNYGLWHQQFLIHDDGIKQSVIQVGASVVATWSFETSKSMQDGDGHYNDAAPVGIYDIYLSNGEVLREAIEIK